MHHNFGRVGCRENGSGKAHNAVHCKCIWRQQFVYSGNQGYGSCDKSAFGELRKCENAEEQQFFAIWEILRDSVQFARRACGSEHQQLLAREVESGWADYERAEFSYFLPVHEGGIVKLSR